MPIKNLKSEVSAIDWSVATLKSDKRMTYNLISPELKKVGSTYPYTVKLEEKPYSASAVEITGFTEVLAMPTSALNFYVDYEDSTVYFHSSQAGKLVKIYYYGMGSVVAARDMNRFATFLCSVKNFLTSFQAEVTDPVSTNVNMTGGYMNTGTNLVEILDKILKFGTGMEFEVPAMTAFYWRKLLLSVNTSTEAVEVAVGVAAITQLAAVIPVIPTNCIPFAVISVQDNGDAGAGTIRNIIASEIEDVRALING